MSSMKLQPKEPEEPIKLMFQASAIEDRIREPEAFENDEKLPSSLSLWQIFKRPGSAGDCPHHIRHQVCLAQIDITRKKFENSCCLG